MAPTSTRSGKVAVLLVGILVLVAVAAGVFFFIQRGGETHEALMEESITIVEDINVLLAGITDQASAEAAQNQLTLLNNRMNELTARSDELGTPDAEKQAELEQLPGYREAMQELSNQFVRLTNDPDALEVVLQALPSLDR